MATFHLTILTPEQVVFEGDVESLTAPGVAGCLGILAHHTPLLAAVRRGVLHVRREEGRKYFAVDESFLHVNGNAAVLLADAAVEVADEHAARQAHEAMVRG
ncbi:MAG TPA: ATP synthase F1 subunit epsilon [Kiritimatiellia bacterium]|nr:ATP synthase F1 subunit epsilon [Kiritimatiellia bacterium]HRZ11009.1 ATP synthase F1 subunit epsilon [Kiritimatiellia bacterium]HSA18582.1 ATP synthase F1 subunit epsilon [Kiritimatiellia bacterium]